MGYDYKAYMDYMDPNVLCPQKSLINLISLSLLVPNKRVIVIVILFSTEYKQWRTEYMSSIITTMKP